jgi:hypothetical protein
MRRLILAATLALAWSIVLSRHAVAVIVGQSDETKLDVTLLPDGSSAELDATFDLPHTVANTRSDQLKNGATEQTAEAWQKWAYKSPFVYTWAASRSLLKTVIPRIMQTGNVRYIAVTIFFVVPDADNPEQIHQFESYNFGPECINGSLPQKTEMTPWAKQVIRDEVRGIGKKTR